MPVISTTQDTDTLTLTLVADLAADQQRAWQLWADPRQLERWWGPPGWPATFPEHSLTVGSESRYYMTGPEGERAHGWWRVRSVDEPKSLEIDEGFSDDQGRPDASKGSAVMHVELAPAGAGTRMTISTRFATLDQMQEVMAMGMEEGLRQAVGQVDALLAA